MNVMRRLCNYNRGFSTVVDEMVILKWWLYSVDW